MTTLRADLCGNGMTAGDPSRCHGGFNVDAARVNSSLRGCDMMKRNKSARSLVGGGVLSIAVGALFAGSLGGYPTVAQAMPIAVQVDIEGFWQPDVTRPMECIRSGMNVTCIMNNAGFAHLLTGTYISP